MVTCRGRVSRKRTFWRHPWWSAILLVNVHVVAAGTSCQAVTRSPTMPAYEQRAPLITRDVGAHTPGGAGLHSRTRSQRGGIGGDGPAVAGAAATGLAPLVAPPVERSASGCGETAAAPTLRAPARWATRTRGADTGLGASRRGERGHPRQARAVPAVPAATAGRRSSASAASSHRDSAGEASHHRVSGPAGGLPCLW